MSLNQTPRSSRVHIALFGNRNAGKSSIINALTGQDIAIVSDVKGTTTDPVYKTMELLPIGPVVFIDTAGLDDEGELGQLRKEKSYDVLNKTDIALILIDATVGITSYDKKIIQLIKSKEIPVLGILNKIDLRTVESSELDTVKKSLDIPCIAVSATTGKNISALKNAIVKITPNEEDKFKIVGDLISPGDFVVLVVPIDKAAPKGRLILPQQQTIRDVLECDAITVVTKEYELKETLENLGKKPSLVITDSQAFLKVAADTPKDIPLTSFSILFARHKGDLAELVKGAQSIEMLENNDTVLVAEACTHHQQADDIAQVKIPRWLRQMTGKNLTFEYCSGTQFPKDLSRYKLIIHCGGCMLNRRAMVYRISQAVEAGIPIVNYGVLIAQVQGVLDRVISPFPQVKLLLEEKEKTMIGGAV
ncbi:iron-only hydrogenase maturation protein HydF [Natronincola peptidivorans]|uniref:Iron-only hydrogenase maturation protein HydF n=1 Tax=Natronincola peptidivorans TaxID=426128 RepID=A0A1I0BHT1_9FIRM|nr:[FeFe] hydrogenase H-cluster maturation GTPase HydF [Natronincola peptidivorans]SET06464.1 iron-only hydrogenase maturation protein HydF [Natronincola peptidivorans]